MLGARPLYHNKKPGKGWVFENGRGTRWRGEGAGASAGDACARRGAGEGAGGLRLLSGKDIRLHQLLRVQLADGEPSGGGGWEKAAIVALQSNRFKIEMIFIIFSNTKNSISFQRDTF